MKNLLRIIVVIAFFSIPTSLSAQVSCRPVKEETYSACCGVGANGANAVDCKAYQNGYSTADQVYVPGTIGGGGQNNVPPTTPINTGQSGASSVGSSQTSAAELSQCSAIKFNTLLDILVWIKCIIVVAIIPLIFALAFFFFLWGVFKFIAASDSIKKEEGKKFILAGLIGLFVMTSIWGIVQIFSTTLGVDGSVVPLLQTECLTSQGCVKK